MDEMTLFNANDSSIDIDGLNIDMSMVSVCKKIRRLAVLDRITLDMTLHMSTLNLHLFKYIEYCGVEPLDFIKSYLRNLQPYMIERRQEQETIDTFICVIDKLYRVSVYIKIDTKQFEEVIVSFHEDNKRGIAKTNSLITNTAKYVPIFADSLLSKDEACNRYVVRAIFQRGLKELPLELSAIKYGDIFIINTKEVDLQFISYCNEYLRDLYTSDLDIDFSQIEIFSMLQQISFTSYGRDTFSSVSLLIDSLSVQKDRESKKVADFALVTFVQNLLLTDEQKDELIELLEQKFLVTSIRGIDLILNRIRYCLRGMDE